MTNNTPLQKTQKSADGGINQNKASVIREILAE
jgi:hypothetical protein